MKEQLLSALMFPLRTNDSHQEQSEVFMKQTLLNAKELSQRIKFSAAYINHTLKDNVFFEGIHYIKPFGGRKIFYIWEEVERELFKKQQRRLVVPMARGGVCHG
ncbi:hypothetical protein [Shewanella glacialipiscicola]|uniref:hypothetical protein n=1 Tax=Shewanella glacialipiscicola TaxID=614069 RepID=UPI003D7B35E4